MILKDTPLPADCDGEAALLAGLLQTKDRQGAYRVLCEIVPGSFFDPRHNALLETMHSHATTAYGCPGVVTMHGLVKSREKSGETALAATLVQVFDRPYSLDTSELAAQWARLANLAWYRAQAVQYSTAYEKAVLMASTAEAIDAEVLAAQKTAMQKYGAAREVTGTEAIESLDAYRARLQSLAGGQLEYGIPALDSRGPILPEYILLLARSSVGKTGLALSLAKNIMLNGSGNGTMRHVLFWSGEQQVYMLTAKLICQLTGCTQQEVLGMTIPDQTSSGKIQMMREALAANRHLHLMDGRQTIDQIWGYAARLRDWHGLAAIFLDQFDKLSHTAGHKGQSKEQVWGESSARLFEMQKDLGCPLFVLAQLGIKNQKDHPRPVAWHVRDCSQLIQDCDRAYVIDRPEAEPERWEQMLAKQPVEARKLEGHARVTLEKNRNGIGGLWSEIIPFSRTCGRFGQHAAGDLDRNKSQSTGYYEQTESTEGKW